MLSSIIQCKGNVKRNNTKINIPGYQSFLKGPTHCLFSAVLYLCTGGRGNSLVPLVTNSLFMIKNCSEIKQDDYYFKEVNQRKAPYLVSSRITEDVQRGWRKIRFGAKRITSTTKSIFFFIQNPFKISSYFILLLNNNPKPPRK